MVFIFYYALTKIENKTDIILVDKSLESFTGSPFESAKNFHRL